MFLDVLLVCGTPLQYPCSKPASRRLFYWFIASSYIRGQLVWDSGNLKFDLLVFLEGFALHEL